MFQLPQNNADILFGGITIIGGIVGTLGGSIILDRMNSTIPNAFKVEISIIYSGDIAVFKLEVAIYILIG